MKTNHKIGVLSGAGYVGRELISLILKHPDLDLCAVSSRSFSGRPVWEAHPDLRGQTDLVFQADADEVICGLDAVFVAAEHGSSAAIVKHLVESGFEGKIVDMSADFRFTDPDVYRTWFGFEHPAVDLLKTAVYGLPELVSVGPSARIVANPGCFATGMALALMPIADKMEGAHVAVTALTGASGSGASPKATTHFPTRDGNVRAYRVLAHQHLPEVLQAIDHQLDVAFVPASGPWTRGIWGTAQVNTGSTLKAETVTSWFETAYGNKPFVRLWPGELPELRYSVQTPFCDLGWVVHGNRLVIGFALDNLLKGAASQAIQNLNLMLGLKETEGLLSGRFKAEPTPVYVDNS